MHAASYAPTRIDRADPSALRTLVPVYARLLIDTLDVILNRYAAHPDYPFIDTKIDLFSGRDASRKVGDVDLFGRETVYAWIQSRGVEALCGHAEWLASLPDRGSPESSTRLTTIRQIVRQVIDRLEQIRAANGGSLFFWMDPQGRPFRMDTQGRRHPITLEPERCYASDMFHVKAVAAAGAWLRDKSLLERAQPYVKHWLREVAAERVLPDQQPFDPKNPVVPPPGRRSHSLRMISLGTLALYARLFDDPFYCETGLTFIRHILDHHLNLDNRFEGLAPLDFVEFIDPHGKPFRVSGAVVCDPGHALEFVGLGFKFLNVIRQRNTLDRAQRALIETCDALLPRILLHVAAQGFNPRAQGICKLYALDRGEALNTDMPWWNLPEGIRATMLSACASPEPAVHAACLETARRLSNAFLGGYVTAQTYPMAWQTLDADGRPSPSVPGTPDLDPGYHTGLSIIDALQCLQDIARNSVQGITRWGKHAGFAPGRLP